MSSSLRLRHAGQADSSVELNLDFRFSYTLISHIPLYPISVYTILKREVK
jgi:hypothetical protein